MKTQTNKKWKACQTDWTGIELIDIETGEIHATIDGCTPEALALIAAAPELLAALREMLAVARRVDDLVWADAVGKTKGTGPCDKARAAIAKAEGRVR